MSPPVSPTTLPWRAALGSTGKPLQWSLLLGALVGGAAGGAAALPLGSPVGAALAAVVSGLTTAVVVVAPPASAVPAGIVAALATTATTMLAGFTTGRPVPAALAMALVALLGSAALAAGTVGAVLGTLGSLSYLLSAVLGTLMRVIDAPVDRVVESILTGTLVAVALAVGVGSWRRGRWRRAHADAPAPAGTGRRTSPWAPIGRSLRTVDEHTRDGSRRAVALGLGMLAFQLQPDRNAMWIFLGAYVVLLPTGRDPLATALVRVVGTLIGVVLVGLLALVVPPGPLLALALVALLGSLLYTQRNPTWSAALMAASVTLLAGAPNGAVVEWGGLRLLDTTVGCALALAAGYLLWPAGTFRSGGV